MFSLYGLNCLLQPPVLLDVSLRYKFLTLLSPLLHKFQHHNSHSSFLLSWSMALLCCQQRTTVIGFQMACLSPASPSFYSPPQIYQSDLPKAYKILMIFSRGWFFSSSPSVQTVGTPGVRGGNLWTNKGGKE